jgi:hypothetical protein
MRLLISILVLFVLAACTPSTFFSPPPPPPPRALTPAPTRLARAYLPLTAGRLAAGPVWQNWPRFKFGVAAAALPLSEAAMNAGRDLPIAGVAVWGVSSNAARWAANAGIVYFPRLSMKVTFSDTDLDGVTNEHADLLRCEPLRSQEAEVRRVATSYPGTTWDLFNEPDNLDLLAGLGCIDETTGGPGYTGFNGNPAMTGPRYAYRQAAAVVHDWIAFVRGIDPTAHFTCCGELNGPSAAYVRGVATAYRELYGVRIPIDAVSLHIYQVDNWNLASYQALLRMAIANLDGHPDLRGLPVSINEGILLTKAMDETSRERSAWLLYHWMDWLATRSAETDRVRFMAWWVDGLCSKVPSENPDWSFCQRQWEITSGTNVWPGTRLYDDKRAERWLLSPAGLVWRKYWCNWTDAESNQVPELCAAVGIEYP